MTERPHLHSKEVIAITAEKYLDDAIAWLNEDDTEETRAEVLDDIKDAFFDSLDYDGYCICKALQENGLWDPDSSLVDMFNNVCFTAANVHRNMVEEWVKANDIKPMLEVGDRVQYPCHSGTVQGTISKIDIQQATYYIKDDDEQGHTRTIIEFERVTKLGS